MFDQLKLLSDTLLAMGVALKTQIDVLPDAATIAVWLGLSILGVMLIVPSWFAAFRDARRARRCLAALVVALSVHGGVLLWLPNTPLQTIDHNADRDADRVEIVLVTIAPVFSRRIIEPSSIPAQTLTAAQPGQTTPASVLAKPKVAAKKKALQPIKPKPVRAAEPKPSKPPFEKAKNLAKTTPAPASTLKTRAAPSVQKAATIVTAKARKQTRPRVTTNTATDTQRRANYFAQLSAWLNKHKRYPYRARKRGQQGTAHLRFVINRQGQVLTASIARSSGFRVLDNEAENMLKRATPLPPIPATIAQSKIELVLPVSFQLR